MSRKSCNLDLKDSSGNDKAELRVGIECQHAIEMQYSNQCPCDLPWVAQGYLPLCYLWFVPIELKKTRVQWRISQ